MNHHARESPKPMLSEMGPSGKRNRVPFGTASTSPSGTRSAPGAPNPCRRMTTGPFPPPFPSVPPVSRVFKPPSMTSRMGRLLMGVEILKQCHDAVEGRLDHRLLVERHEGALFIGFHLVDDELNLLHADIT